MPYPPFPAAPLIWTMRLVKGSTLTHLELDDNQKALNQKINDTEGANVGTGQQVYRDKFKNANTGFLNFRSLVEGPGVTINTIGNDIIISSSGGTAGTGDTHVSNVTYTADTICITLNNGTQWCVNMSGDTPYEYGTGIYSIQPKRDGSFASADYSNIGGGLNNIISSGGTYSNIAGGDTNIIHGNYGFIGGGKNNLIQSATTYASILNGSGNTITANTQSTTILGGDNLIGNRSHTTFMNGLDADTDSISGQVPFRYHGNWANEGLGRILMDMTGAGDSQWVSSAIFPLNCDDPCPSSGSGIHQIVEGYHSGCTLYMTDCSGTTVTADTCCVTTGPYAWRGGIDSITTTLPLIGQAGENKIHIRAEYSTIQGGLSNRILSGVTFSSILNGSGNTISSTIAWPSGSGFTGNTNVTAAAVLGSIGRTATLSETTYVTGLDALTDGYDGFKKPFRYHGNWANEGNGKVLREIVGNGDARWIYSPFPVVNTGDTCTNVIMSAFTTGNTLTVIDANGNIYTAFTCSIFAGPYEYGSGLDSIQPILDSPFATSNFSSIGGGVSNKVIGVKSGYSRIGGGQNNIINSIGTSSADTASLHSYIGGGDNNTIIESAKSAIVGGERNSITGGTHNIIGGGNDNIINESIKSAIVGGEDNLITGGTHNIIGGGEHNVIKPRFTYNTILSGVTADSTTHSIIGAGKDNLIVGSDNSSIISGSLNVITGGTHNHIGSGVNNTLDKTTTTTILNGANNTISASTQSLVGGGSNNTIINGLASSIVNGTSNTINKGTDSIISGGITNLLDTVTASTIVVGQENTIGQSDRSSIVSGLQNIITASTKSIIGAGANNEILDTSSSSSLISGVDNKVIRSKSVILGSGSANTITHSSFSVLGAGENNLISGETSSSIVGGKDNIILRGATKDYNIIGGGDGNLITNTTKSAIVAGENNTVTASTHSIVGAGLNNIMNSDSHSTLSSGIDNLILSGDSNILGSGIKNKITSSDRAALMAGSGNTINVSLDSSLVGGVNNTIDDSDSALLGAGLNNSIIGVSNMSSLVSGELNVVTASTHSILGSGIKNKIINSDRAALMAGSGNTINLSDSSFVGSGELNLIDKSKDSSIVGGKNNTITASTLSSFYNYGVIDGGINNSLINSGISIIGAGDGNTITKSGNSLIGSGFKNDIVDSNHTSIVGGYTNFVRGFNVSSFIGGGLTNTIGQLAGNGGENNFIGGGNYNIITDMCVSDGIVGGSSNSINEQCNWDFIGGGMGNRVGDGSWIGGTNSNYSSIVGGKDNYISYNEWSAIVGGENNLITGGTHNIIGGGEHNIIKPEVTILSGVTADSTTHSIIGAGKDNLIVGSDKSFIGSGHQNQIHNSDYTIIGAGQLNVVKEASTHSVIAGGRDNDIYQVSPYSVIGGGRDNDIFSGSPYSVIVGGDNNKTRWSNHSFIGTGTINENREADYSVVVGGYWNRNYYTRYSFIGGGSGHTINTRANYGTIGGGAFNRISRDTPYATIAGGYAGFIDCLSPYSIIGGGEWNTILSAATHTGIFNGSGNTISANTIATAIIGSVNRVGDVTETTFTRGIDANTDGYDGVNRPFRYHGSWASQGFGRILTDMTGLGDAVWMNAGVYQICDDVCPIVSAWTSDSGCTINFVDCTGTTTTADTCCTITGPYAWRGGIDSITTTLPLVGQAKENKIRGSAKYSTIQGGLSNLIGPSVDFSSILNGSGNTIFSGANYSAIVGSKGRTAVTPETTYVTGLDALTDGNDGLNKPFRYHGAYASEGTAGHVLTSTNALGDAYWAPGPGMPEVPTGCTITGITTVGCIATFHVVGGPQCTGTTLTANTCDGSYSPYRPTGGVNSITTTLHPPSPQENFIDVSSDYSTISAGWKNQIISGSSWSNVLGGDNNIIHKASYAAIINGSGNTINHPNSVIMGGDGITTDRISTVFMNGLDVNTNSTTTVSGLTQQAFKYHGIFANHGNPGDVLTSVDALGNAKWLPPTFPPNPDGCSIVSAMTVGCVTTFFFDGAFSGCSAYTFTADTCDGSYSPYRPTGTDSIVPTVPQSGMLGENIIDIPSANSNIGGGTFNRVNNSSMSLIAGGGKNVIKSGSTWSNIGGGLLNTIIDSKVSSILGGNSNKINISGGTLMYGLIGGGSQNEVTAEYGSVINGSGNTVNHAFSAIIGSQAKTTDRTYTTFTEGLDVDSNRGGTGNTQAFRYHGTFASPGTNRVLTDIDGLGNAVWKPNIVWPNDPDCPVVSAYTSNSGCTLHLINCSGDTFTADTCNQFGSYSPYMIGAGIDSIQPILPLGSNLADGDLTNIGGGWGNRLFSNTLVSNIGGGLGNLIGGVGGIGAFIGGGTFNLINNSSFSSIVGGSSNWIQLNSLNSAILGGKQNIISTASTESSIVGGSNNTILRSDESFIGGGYTNLISPPTGASVPKGNIIVGGSTNIITASQGHSTIVGGFHNMITGYHTSFIGGGHHNQVFQSAESVIVGGSSNYVKSMQSYNFVGGGTTNIIGDASIAPAMCKNVIVGGENNQITDKPYLFVHSQNNFIGGGGDSAITGSSYSFIGGGQSNEIYGVTAFSATPSTGTHSFIGGGQNNLINVGEGSMIGSGYGNIIRREEHAFIGGGSNNTVQGPGTWKAFIGAGAGNQIEPNQPYSSIVGGINNIITKLIFSGGTNGGNSILGGQSNTISGTTNSSILNGSNNLIIDGWGNMDSVAIIGGSNIIADRDNTTFMEGLDVDTNLNVLARPFRYHGTYASNGFPGHVLTSVNALGDAHWQPLPSGPIVLYSGCPIMSAYTTNTGCTLNLVDCSGRTFTASTCGTFGALSPYEFRANSSISTVIPAGGTAGDNFISNNQTYSNIQGGQRNSINAHGAAHNAIGGGWSNAIGGDNFNHPKSGNTAYAVIAGGYDNRILGFDTQGEFIGAGRDNAIRSGSQSSILGGDNNLIRGAIKASILGGQDNTIQSIVGVGNGNYSSIVNGQDNTINFNSSVIIGADNITADMSHTTFMNGLNVASASAGGNRFFRYWGGVSNAGTIGDVLTQVDTLGNAVWMTPCCSGGTSSTGNTFDKYCSTDDYIVNVPIAHTHGIGGPSGACGVVINIWDEDGYKVDGEVRELNAFQVEVTLSETQNYVKVVII